ncbi:Chitinase 2 [Basidiobolus ranarum]|uniref:chitinase n=1 Tax=Basidiobolus ranarum TaxID=34480 RepID=A0ABR2WB60_9FUNG
MVASHLLSICAIFTGLRLVLAFDEKCDTNFVTYWGQNSYGITNPDHAKWEKPLRGYCEDDTVDVINLSFMNVFNAGTQLPPQINLSFHCASTHPGTSVLNCPDIGKDIEYCQSKGKKIIMSLGGATGSYGFSNDADAGSFAQTLWDSLLGGSSDKRPFGTAKLDGIDLDIEGGSSNGYSSFIKALRELYAKDSSKKYYITGAPQCPFPDIFLGQALSNSWFDMVFVQFYNNYCSASNPAQFNFEVWNTWATTQSVNKDVKIYLGVPGSGPSAGSGYIPATQINQIIDDIRKKYSSFGGVMAWDASSSDMNIEGGISFAASVKNKLKASPVCGAQKNPSPPQSPTIPTIPAIPTIPTISAIPALSSFSSPVVPVSSSSISVSSSLAGGSSTGVSKELPSSSAPAPTLATSTPSIPLSSTSSTTLPNLHKVTCPVEGSPCVGNEVGCSGYNYAVCLNGRWLLRPCSTDQLLLCAKGSSGIYCDWAAGKSIETCGAPNSLYRRKIVAEEVKEKGNKDIMIDIVKQTGEQETQDFTALVRIRTTLSSSISNNWQVQFSVPDNSNITQVSRGQFKQDGSMVTVKSNPNDEPKQNMVIIFEIKGITMGQPRPILTSKRPLRALFEDLGSS